MADKALVLGGGGVTGVAWMFGMVAGLAEAGVDLRSADLVIGTSAGSVVGVRVASGGDLDEAYAGQLAGYGNEIAARVGTRTLLRWGWAAVRARDPRRYGARVGAMALAARTVPEADRRAVIESRLSTRDWPPTRLLITAVDAESGEFVVFERDSGVSLVDAVAASCAVPGVWPPVTIGERRYIDGGVRSLANAELAAGSGQVVVLAPITRGFGSSVARQLASVDAPSVVVSPDAAARTAIGRNALDPGRRGPAARAGRTQAAAVAASVAKVWSAG